MSNRGSEDGDVAENEVYTLSTDDLIDLIVADMKVKPPLEHILNVKGGLVDAGVYDFAGLNLYITDVKTLSLIHISEPTRPY